LQQATEPLVLADGRSLDRRRHQLRYGLPTGSFLDRDDDQVINDIWHLLHDDAQQWYFRSDMDHRSALVFNTLSTPHGAGVLPGEDIAERCSLALEAAESAAASGDADGLLDAVRAAGETELSVPTTPSLRDAIAAMVAVLDDAAADPAGVCGVRREDWAAASQAARRAVVRMSLEMRMVVSIEA
jgi:hypothetical protein